MDADRRLLIVGASARAAAHSALRAGFSPIAVDLFGDRDLRQVASTLTVRHWPRDIPAVCRNAPAAPWMFTGALENYPRIVAAVSAGRPLWGNPAPVLRRVRDPARVFEALHEAGLPAVEVRPESDPPPRDGRWLLKPLRSAGGRGIRRWTAGVEPLSRREPCYFQRSVPGTPISAVYVGTPPTATLLGISRQLIGMEALSAAPFAYCGSIGPVSLPADVTRSIERTGSELAVRFGLRGLFGVDFILDDGAAFLTEVNPRYTASVEVLERALGVSAIARHAQAFNQHLDRPPEPTAEPRIVAKTILYAPRSVASDALEAIPTSATTESLPTYADLPNPGEQIPRGRPICTALADGATWDECVQQLNERLAALRQVLRLPGGGVSC